MNMSQEVITAKWGEHTLIIIKRALAVPKTALAGVGPEISFARFKASMAALSKEKKVSLAGIVETRGGCEEKVWRKGCKGKPEPHVYNGRPFSSHDTTCGHVMEIIGFHHRRILPINPHPGKVSIFPQLSAL